VIRSSQLVPFALAFPPLVALRWEGVLAGWLAVDSRGARRLHCPLRDFPIGSERLHVPPSSRHVGFSPRTCCSSSRLCLGGARSHNDEAGAIGNELLSWMIPVAMFFWSQDQWQGEVNLRRASRVLVSVALGVAIYSGLRRWS